MKKRFILVVFYMTEILSCNLPNSNGPHSNILIGKWEYLTSVQTQGGSNYRIGHIPSMLFTFNHEIEFEKSGKGKFIYKHTLTSDDKLDYSYTNVYQTEWFTSNNGEDDFIVITKRNGKNININGENRAKIEQDADIEINKTNGTNDTLYFKAKDNQELLCHATWSKEEWKMTKKE